MKWAIHTILTHPEENKTNTYLQKMVRINLINFVYYVVIIIEIDLKYVNKSTIVLLADILVRSIFCLLIITPR